MKSTLRVEGCCPLDAGPKYPVPEPPNPLKIPVPAGKSLFPKNKNPVPKKLKPCPQKVYTGKGVLIPALVTPGELRTAFLVRATSTYEEPELVAHT